MTTLRPIPDQSIQTIATTGECPHNGTGWVPGWCFKLESPCAGIGELTIYEEQCPMKKSQNTTEVE